MYQAVYYDREEKQYYLRDDKRGWKQFQYWPTYYFPHEDGEFETLDGNRVMPTKKIADWNDVSYYEKDVDKCTRLLVDYYYESDDTPKYHNIVYLDIECEIAGALTEESIKNAPTKVTSVALYDNNSKKYYCLILDEQQLMSEAKSESKEVIPYKTEKELDEWREKYYHQLEVTTLLQAELAALRLELSEYTNSGEFSSNEAKDD